LQPWARTTFGTILKSFLVPGGILLFVVVILAHSGWPTLALPSLSFLRYCAFIGGILLAWRFHSSRIFFALVVLFLAGEAVEIFSGTSVGVTYWAGLRTAAVLVPLDFALVAVMQESGFTASNMAPVGMLLFIESIIVTVFSQAASLAPHSTHTHHATAPVFLPDYALLAFAGAGVFLTVRYFLTRKPVDSALLWSLAAFFLSLRFTGSPRISTLYSTGAACILASSIIENSYLLAYRDELTSLPSRRAFNDALLRLHAPYSIAIVDIDHFKRFNDTYGHDIGDQVLRLVAAHLAHVTGGGQTYRCGGEEFTILFPGKTTGEIRDHLEKLRSTIETSEFRMRGSDRRQVPRGPERRNVRAGGRARKGDAIRKLAQEKASTTLTVTVSIGAATSGVEEAQPESVVKAADKSLYKAKANGRNRVEVAATLRPKARTKAAGIA
jgi:diguanylate cyclase (GGDEF)-like protein